MSETGSDIKQNLPQNCKSRLHKECSWASLPKTWIDQPYRTVPMVGVLRQWEWKSCFYTMEGEACSFQEIVGGKCGFSSKIKKSLWNSSHCSTAPVIQISISLHLPLLMCRIMTFAHVFKYCSQDRDRVRKSSFRSLTFLPICKLQACL